jgi:hypothetical protein
MNTNIRIIKRSQRDAQSKTNTDSRRARSSSTNRTPNSENPRHAAREITGHVATWIKEFQQRHTPDPRRAFANLFVDPATSSID